MTTTHRIALACFASLLGSVGFAQQPAARVTPGEFIVDPPTLINLGFEWLIDGDANRNAYRSEIYANQTTINATTRFEGTYYLTADGTAEKPIVIKGAGDGGPQRPEAPHRIGAFWEQFNGVNSQVFPPIMAWYTAIRLYGPGHVVAHNDVADFHDGIDTEMYGMPDGSHANEGPAYPPREFWDRRPVSIDIYNNYITNAHDNSIEMDGSMHNIRIMRNVLINSASHPMST